jgi:hypothetical protein
VIGWSREKVTQLLPGSLCSVFYLYEKTDITDALRSPLIRNFSWAPQFRLILPERCRLGTSDAKTNASAGETLPAGDDFQTP